MLQSAHRNDLIEASQCFFCNLHMTFRIDLSHFTEFTYLKVGINMLCNLKKDPKSVAFPLFYVFLHRFVISVRNAYTHRATKLKQIKHDTQSINR